jgi:hypothetical protein
MDRIFSLQKPLLLLYWTKTKLNSVAVVRKRTIPIERATLVGEVSVNVCG